MRVFEKIIKFVLCVKKVFFSFNLRVNSKRNFDELGSGSGWARFAKRNFDEIDGGRGGFGSRFVKKVVKSHF